jgi:multicomponent Na+:H+ antiporter subunit D
VGAYGLTGTLNMADWRGSCRRSENPGAVVTRWRPVPRGLRHQGRGLPAVLLAARLVPHADPVAVSAIFAGLLTKVGVYAMMRCSRWSSTRTLDRFTHTLILWVVAAGTMVVGVLGAAAHYEIRRILSFHIISQIGYMIMGLGCSRPWALAGAVLYILHHIVVKANLFLVSGVDRVVALDLLATLGIGIVVVYAINQDQPAFLDVAVILALVAFLGTVAFAFYIEKRSGS